MELEVRSQVSGFRDRPVLIVKELIEARELSRFQALIPVYPALERAKGRLSSRSRNRRASKSPYLRVQLRLVTNV